MIYLVELNAKEKGREGGQSDGGCYFFMRWPGEDLDKETVEKRAARGEGNDHVDI